MQATKPMRQEAPHHYRLGLIPPLCEYVTRKANELPFFIISTYLHVFNENLEAFNIILNEFLINRSRYVCFVALLRSNVTFSDLGFIDLWSVF